MNIRFILRRKVLIFLCISIFFLFLNGCATPVAIHSGPTAKLHPDEDDNIGGTFLESNDIRTIAQQMAAEILSIPEISHGNYPKYIAISPIKNSSRFIVDKNIFMKRLRIELNKVAGKQIRFFSQYNASQVRKQIWREKREVRWQKAAEELADYLLLKLKNIKKYRKITIAVAEPRNLNITGLNADSFLALLRMKMAEKSPNNVAFLSSQKSHYIHEAYAKNESVKDLGADFILTGDFVGEGIHQVEGEKIYRPKVKNVRTKVTRYSVEASKTTAKIYLIFKQNPNANLWFNANLINLNNHTVIEKSASLKKIMTTGVGKAQFILSGELSGLSKASQGALRSDYLILGFQLVDPESNEIIWEDAYESKKASGLGTVYR